MAASRCESRLVAAAGAAGSPPALFAPSPQPPAAVATSTAISRTRRAALMCSTPRFDPPIDLALEDLQRHRAVAQDLAVKITDVEAWAQLGLRLAAQRLDAQIADLVPERLSGPCDVALDLGLDVRGRERRVRDHVFDRLLAGPALGVQAGIHHQPHRAQLLVVETAEPLVRIGEHAELATEELRVQSPALDVGGVIPAEAAEARQPGQLLLDRNLEVMTR